MGEESVDIGAYLQGSVRICI